MNASSAGISTAIPIYMLSLGGSVREVALAAFLSNLAVTLGAIFWGKLIDSMHWRKTIIVVCSAATAIVAVSMSFVSSLPLLMLISALAGFFSVGPAPVTNLLVMEKSRKEDWVKTFSWTSLISAGGLVIAMLVGYLWLMHYSAQTYAVICSVIAIASLVLTLKFVQDPQVPLARKAMTKSPALFDRLRQVPIMFLKPVSDLSLTTLRSKLSRREFLFFAGVGLYFLSGNLLSTPYTPFLKDSGVSDSEVFLAYTMLHMSRVLFLPFNHRIIARAGEEAMGKLAYLPRIFGLLIAVVAAFLLAGNPTSVLVLSLVAFVAIEVGFSIWSTTTTSSLLKIIPGGREGSVLGVNSSIIGAGLLIGSIAAGESAATLGYGTTFAIAIGFLIASFALISKFFAKVKVAKEMAA